MKKTNLIEEKSRQTTIECEVDVCVIGGSCTGVFAAVRAARLGAKVAIIEKQNSFGGVATQGLVHIWHSLKDSEYKQDIISGLTREVLDRLSLRNAVMEESNSCAAGFYLNTEELKIELDSLVIENNIKPFLHTLFVAPYFKNGRLDAVILENKSGRSAVRAKVFIDASGDGDLVAHIKGLTYSRKHLQPPTTCAKIEGTKGAKIADLIMKHHKEFNLPKDWGWSSNVVGMPNLTMHAETHVFDVDCSNASDLTHAEMEGRRQVRAYMDIVRKYSDFKPVLVDLASYIGIRETRHIHSLYQITEKNILLGDSFDDVIGYGTYRVDIHHENRAGITLRYLDGRESVFEDDTGWKESRWRPQSEAITPFYQIPLRALIPKKSDNIMVAGRLIDADTGAYGALRVMVNCNQTGEAAGVTAALAADNNMRVDNVFVGEIQKKLREGGAL